jgi:hypothetical protein
MNILKSTAVLLSSVLTSSAAVVYFDISPAGSDVAVGLSPANMVPPVINSTGSGGSISGGVYFDTDTSLLHFAMGYGSAAGFADLTSPVTAITINLSAPPGSNAPPLFVLSDKNFPALDPSKGGVIYGSVFYPEDPLRNPVTNLLAGLEYIVIYTASNPATAGTGGELRGQLVPAPTPGQNLPPFVSCPNATTVECGRSATVSVLPASRNSGGYKIRDYCGKDDDAGSGNGRPDRNSTRVIVLVADPEGDAMTVLWTLNGVPVQTNGVPASDPPAAALLSFRGALPLGSNVVQVTVTDTATNTASCSTTVTVIDRSPPVVLRATVQPPILSPPDHKMVAVKVSALVVDTCSSATWKIIGVRSNEPEDGLGEGDTAPDWLITGDDTVLLRAERSPIGRGRIYTITIQAEDASGNLSDRKRVTVIVPKGSRFGDNGDDDDDDKKNDKKDKKNDDKKSGHSERGHSGHKGRR